MLVTCPSGLAVELRKLKVQEANILADRQTYQKGATLDQLLASVWVSTLDVGPYKFGPGNKPLWEQVLVGDRFYAQMQVRIATHGPHYDFRVPCSVCKEIISWSVNLADLPVTKLKQEDAAIFTDTNVFKELGPDGKQITFHLMTGVHERKAQMILKQNKATRVTASLLSRIDEVEGEKDRRSYFDNLDFTVALDLIKMLDDHDCGIETTFDIECGECGAETEVDLPLDQKGYWAPSRKATKTGT